MSMERAKFKERMKALKAYKNKTGKGYWDWKVQAYTDGTDGDDDKLYVGRTDQDYYGNLTHNIVVDTNGDEVNFGLPDIVITPKNNLSLGTYNYNKKVAKNVADAASFVPGVGEVIDATVATKDASEGDFTTAAGLGLGLFIPNVIEKPAKWLWKGIKKLPKQLRTRDDFQWDRAYFQALENNDIAEAQRLRDLHFLQKSNTVVTDELGMPLKTYHTVGEKFNPDFTVFKMDPNNNHSSVFTTDDPLMSASYYRFFSSDEELKLLANNLNVSIDDLKAELISKKMWSPERSKELYIKLNNPVTIDAKQSNWNAINSFYLPTDFLNDALNKMNKKTAAYYHPGYLSTDDIEMFQNRLKKYDGAVIKQVKDYGVSKNFYPEQDLYHTVYQINKTSNLKLSDAITYDDKGKIIPLSKRDNWNNPDIRYGFAPLMGLGAASMMMKKNPTVFDENNKK